MKRTRKIRSTSDKLTPRDRYLRKKFCISQKEYDEALRRNGGVCSISGKPQLGEKALHVDHDHKIERWKIVSKKQPNGDWLSWPYGAQLDEVPLAPTRMVFCEIDRLKQVSRAKVKARLKRLSVRGILNWQSNSAIQKFNDDPELMENAATYIRNYQKFLAGESDWRNGFEGE